MTSVAPGAEVHLMGAPVAQAPSQSAHAQGWCATISVCWWETWLRRQSKPVDCQRFTAQNDWAGMRGQIRFIGGFGRMIAPFWGAAVTAALLALEGENCERQGAYGEACGRDRADAVSRIACS